MARQYVSTIKQNFDYSKINSHLFAATQLTYIIQEVIDELKVALQDNNLYIQDIKSNIKGIYKKLQTYPKVDFNKLDIDSQLNYCDDYNDIEDIIFSLFNLRDTYKYAFYAKYEIGSLMWTIYEGKERLVKIHKIDFGIDNVDGESVYNRNYQCYLLNSKTQKPTRKDLVLIKEGDLYNHKKELNKS